MLVKPALGRRKQEVCIILHHIGSWRPAWDVCNSASEKYRNQKAVQSDPRGLRHRNGSREEGYIPQRPSGNLVG